MNFHENKLKLREKPETANVGLKWSSDEDIELLSEAKQKMNISDIALKHKRTEGGIRSRLRLLACSFIIEQGLSLQEASELVNLSEDDISKSLLKRQNAKSKKETTPKLGALSTKSENDDKYKELLIEIRDLLKILVENNNS